MSATVHVVEDNAIKAASIVRFFSEYSSSILDVSVSGSYQSALRTIQASAPDLIILDMTIPTFDRKPNSREGRMRPLGGYDLMHKMKHRSIRSYVIVVTQLETFGEGEEEVSFAEIVGRCKHDFPDFFLGGVYYDQGGVNWQDDLAALVEVFFANRQER
jgi:CheY-like chemotaxis protein